MDGTIIHVTDNILSVTELKQYPRCFTVLEKTFSTAVSSGIRGGI